VTVRILQIGAGIRGRHWIEYVKAFAGTECVALVEPDPANQEKARALLGPSCRIFTELDAALATVEADAALIASPDRLHAEQAMACLDRGLTVMIEKPFTPTVAEAARVLARAAEVGRQVALDDVAEAFVFHFGRVFGCAAKLQPIPGREKAQQGR